LIGNLHKGINNDCIVTVCYICRRITLIYDVYVYTICVIDDIIYLLYNDMTYLLYIQIVSEYLTYPI